MTEGRSNLEWNDARAIAKGNLFASVAAILSVLMWLTDTKQLGSITVIAPAVALGCGLFGVVFSIWVAIRDTRPHFLAYGLWAIAPLLWTAYYLLVLHPDSLIS